ncbi:MAG: hypothetical protein ACD_4C00108G0001 [uncultured bacterium (gcode 4)]|uniref:Uncharacterized protein n=1 Tax=uncultured bacterium (gcode 4) TaxID=1234023 RepID=K2FYH5_9BACT|nr:MAG: hypothetical protein ACD_4C00108G0001 [uncultured bacterium (gcode 4)]
MTDLPPIQIDQIDPAIVKQWTKESMKWVSRDIQQILLLNWMIWADEMYPEDCEKFRKKILSTSLKDYNKEITVVYSYAWVFRVLDAKTGNVLLFLDSNWDIELSLLELRNKMFIKNWKALESLWYIEINENWVYHLYELSKDIKDWLKPSLWKKIKSDKSEYFKIWKDISFVSDSYDIEYMIKNKIKCDENIFKYYIYYIRMNFEDLEVLRDNQSITSEMFQFWVEELWRRIGQECEKQNFSFVWKDFTESQVKDYFNKWYIKDYVLEFCLRKIEERED